ncbi:hypothetical protein EYZ11_013262 [Aspergillus tanneri]|uniref:Uncharacterized protein n=1 Tax=Aspergillus tanneri TaxID=1220188 RepID=A0A4S3IY70_9EURO|nr:hypothetical protein EYZ11_013262 [Aspergillus tanneri]
MALVCSPGFPHKSVLTESST